MKIVTAHEKQHSVTWTCVSAMGRLAEAQRTCWSWRGGGGPQGGNWASVQLCKRGCGVKPGRAARQSSQGEGSYLGPGDVASHQQP